ncbi:MAG: aldo/keto reductase, partial [bacterium]|nr:aldo/keto reductase [bacterium]
IGRAMKTRRKEVFLVTKIQDRTYDDVMRIMEGSLRRLQSDQVDLVHMHGLGNAADLAAMEAPDGALKALHKIRDEKMARFIGVTCHADPVVLKTLLERHDLDCTQMALNAARVGASAIRGLENSFETLAMPVALNKNMGVTAMKVFAQEKLLGDAPPEQLVRYAMSLPVASAVVGMPKLELLDANIQTAKSFQPMPESEMKQLSTRISRAKKASLDRYFLRHQDVC